MDHAHLRNRVRHELIPYIQDRYNPLLRKALCRLGEVQREENAFLDAHAKATMNACVDEGGCILRHAFAEAHLAVQRRMVLLLAWRQGVDCPFERVERAREFVVSGRTGQSYDLGGGVLLRNNRDTTEFRTTTALSDDTEVGLVVPGTVVAFGRCFRAHVLDVRPEAALSQYCSPSRQVFDADRLGTNLVVRHRRPGDRFRPFGMEGSKKLKDYLIDVGMPASQRDAQVLLMADDTIAWVVGLAISSHAAVTSDTKRILELEVSDATQP
jgi:tRNA(Ile)-lysidine synthase